MAIGCAQDLGRMDADGCLCRVEGIDHPAVFIVPREIDEVLYEHPDVVEAAAFARPCPQYGERVGQPCG